MTGTSAKRPSGHTASILRWEVPVDDRRHHVPAGIVHVASRRADVVEVWTKPSNLPDLVVQVVGTGHPFPPDWTHLGTALAPHGLVWHLMATGENVLALFGDPADSAGSVAPEPTR
jgi:hypothetical protein